MPTPPAPPPSCPPCSLPALRAAPSVPAKPPLHLPQEQGEHNVTSGRGRVTCCCGYATVGHGPSRADRLTGRMLHSSSLLPTARHVRKTRTHGTHVTAQNDGAVQLDLLGPERRGVRSVFVPTRGVKPLVTHKRGCI